jgi:hypothetical protein
MTELVRGGCRYQNLHDALGGMSCNVLTDTLHRVSLAFEVDPTALSAILSDFEELLSWRHPDV